MAQATLVRPNPALTRGFARVSPVTSNDLAGGMTLQGTVNKTFALTAILVAGGAVGWASANSTGAALFYVALIGAFVVGLVTSFKPEIARYTSPIYALLEGFVLGALSNLMNASYPGIVVTAVELTLGILVAMLFIYSTGIIKVTQKFRIAVAAATFGVVVAFAMTLLVNAFGGSVGFVQGNGLIAIGFSLLVIAIGCANLIVDFDFIQRGVAAQLPRHMEWYGAFSVMVTLVWLYIEVLRLLSKLRSR